MILTKSARDHSVPDTESNLSYLAAMLAAIAATLFLFFAASWVLVTYYVTPNDNLVKSLAILHGTTSPIAAFGDSRMAFDFPAGQGVVNLAYMGESVADMNRRIDIWASRVPHRHMAIVEADPHLFSIYRNEGKPKRYLIDASGDSGWPIERRHRPFLLSYWYVALFGGGFESDKFLFRPFGWQENHEDFATLSPFARLRWAQGRIAQQTPQEAFEQSDTAKAYEAMIGKLARGGVAICMVTTPVSPPYFAIAKRKARILEAVDFFSSIATRYNARYVNFLGLYSAVPDIELFADSDHLNVQGARSFGPLVRSACGLGVAPH